MGNAFVTELISLLVTTYNVENFIERAIKSALNQTYPHVEIIVVDDASTDSTWEKLQRFAGKITLIRHKKRKRVSAALNTGLKKSRGSYIARLDGDDELHPSILEKELTLLKNHQECGFVYSDYEEIDESGKLIRKVSLSGFSPELVHHIDYIAMGNLVRKSCYDKIGWYDETMKKQEHYDWSIRLFTYYKGLHLPEILFTYTRHPKQATANINDLQFYTEKIRKKYKLKSQEVVRW